MRKVLVGVVVFAAAACGGPKPVPPTAPPSPPVAMPPPPVPAQIEPPPPPAQEMFLAECRAPLADAKRTLASLKTVKSGRSTDDVLEGFNEINRYLANAANLAQLIKEVHPDKLVREAAQICAQEAQKFQTDLLLDRDVYDMFKTIDTKPLDADTRRYVSFTLRDFHRGGVDLDEDKRGRIKAIDEEITQLGQKFEAGISEDTRYIEVKDPARLVGMPADWIATHKPDDHGVIKITTDYPDYIPFIAHADDDELRKQLYIQFRSRGSAHNEEYLGKILVLRAERAKMLGFKDWADFQSDDKMLRGGKAAQAFVDRVEKLAEGRAKRDYAELLKQLQTHDKSAKVVNDWQRYWLEDQVKRAKYTVDSNEVRTYFDYDSTLAGLLEITSKIYDIDYKKVDGAKVWHPDVAVYDVVRGADKLGRIYLDMHPRDGKYKHAAQFPLVDGVVGKQLPEGALVCNLPDPKVSKPALMDHGDVVTMFHEFGHLMHHVLGGHHHWIRQTGVATEADFVEAPSQMFEEWAWRYETLSRFAKNAAGQVIPKDLVDKMRRAEKFGLGTSTEQQMFYASIALDFHQADPAKLDQLAEVKRMQVKYTPFSYVEGTKFHTSFGHLVGYSSMYYTYMWSLVIAKAMLAPFDQKGSLMATDVTHKYRDKVLVPGGSKDAADLVKDFLGKPYDFRAFERYLSE